MSDLPQMLYAPSVKDRQAQLVPHRYYSGTIQNSAAATTLVIVTPQDFIDKDEVLLLRHVFCLCSGTGGQNTTAMFCGIIPFAATPELIRLMHAPAQDGSAARPTMGMSWQGELVMMFGDHIRLDGFWSAGVATNFISMWIAGVKIPRGNWQQ